MEGKEFFALLNACMNGLCTVLLVIAYVMIKRKKYAAHGYFMASAFLVSSVFLCSYLYSHYAFGERTTTALGLNSTLLKTLYLVILIPHVILAVVMLPFILLALWRAYTRQWTRHTKVSVPGFWIWLYVSVTGVVVYALLYHVLPAAVAAQGAA